MSTDTDARTALPGEDPGKAPEESRAPGGNIFDDGIPTPEEMQVIEWLLTTTRTVRKTLDLTRPVELDVVQDCLRLAIQAPTAHNTQRWHWIVVTDREKIRAIGDVYLRTWRQTTRGEKRQGRRFKAATASNESYSRIEDSATWLAEHMHEVPLMVVPCIVGPRPDDNSFAEQWIKQMEMAAKGPTTGLEGKMPSLAWIATGYYASIYPAVWQFQLALRSRGLGSTLTMNHLAHEDLVAEILELPSMVTQTCMLPVAYTQKRVYGPAKRQPLESKLSFNTYGGDTP